MVMGLDRKGATYKLIHTITDLYSDEPTIKIFLKKNRFTLFRYLDSPIIAKACNVAEHHFSVRSELFKRGFKT